MEIPKVFKDRIDQFSIENLIEWTKELFNFYFRPKFFFIRLWSKDNGTQTNQVIYYVCLTVIVLFFVDDDMSVKNVFHATFALMLQGIFFSLLIMPINKIVSGKTSIGLILYYIVLLVCLFSIPQLIFLHLFIVNESYVFYLVSNIITVAENILIFFGVWNALYSSRRKIVFCYSITIIALNIILFSAAMIEAKFSDVKELNSTDPIIEEFNSRVEPLGNIGVPFSRVNFYEQNRKTVVTFGYTSDNGLTANKEMDSNFIKTTLRNNIYYIDTVRAKLRFNYSKKMFNELSVYFKSIDGYLDTYPCDTCLIEIKVTKRKKDSVVLSRFENYVIDSSYIQPYIQFNRDRDRLQRWSTMATKPIAIYNYLFYPANYLFDRIAFYDH